MSKPEFRKRRSTALYRWTSIKILTFLRQLAESGSVAVAARGVGMSRQSAYRLRARLGADFARLWDEAIAIAHGDRAMPQGDATGRQSAPQGDAAGPWVTPPWTVSTVSTPSPCATGGAKGLRPAA